jgi:hypothetical protein
MKLEIPLVGRILSSLRMEDDDIDTIAKFS